MLPPGLQTPGSPAPISYNKLLITEGGDAFSFFKAALRHLGLLDQIEIRNLGGVTDWSAYLPVLVRTDGFAHVVSLALVRDAETDCRAAFQSACAALARAHLPVPPQPAAAAPGSPSVAVFILPDCHRPGMLETLCLEAVANDPATVCVDRYFNCLSTRKLVLPANLEKARVRAFLASRTRPHRRLGQAAEAGYWDWSSPVFEPLFRFLTAI